MLGEAAKGKQQCINRCWEFYSMTTDGLDEPPRLFCSGSWATVMRHLTVVSITLPMFSPRRNTERKSVLYITYSILYRLIAMFRWKQLLNTVVLDVAYKITIHRMIRAESLRECVMQFWWSGRVATVIRLWSLWSENKFMPLLQYAHST